MDAGASPDEAMWRLNRTLAFSVTQQTGTPPDEAVINASPSGIPFDLSFLQDAASETGTVTGQLPGWEKVQREEDLNRFERTSAGDYLTAPLERAGRKTFENVPLNDRPLALTSEDIARSHSKRTPPRTIQFPPDIEKERVTAASPATAEQIANQTVRQNTELFPNGVPAFATMTEEQKEFYLKARNAARDLKGDALSEEHTNIFNEFKTPAAGRTDPTSGQKAASIAKVGMEVRKHARALNFPRSLRELNSISTAQRYRDNMEEMKRQNPQQWAETFTAAREVDRGLTEKAFMEAQTRLMTIQGEMARLSTEASGNVAGVFDLVKELIKSPEIMDKDPDLKKMFQTVMFNVLGQAQGADFIRLLEKQKGISGFFTPGNLTTVIAPATQALPSDIASQIADRYKVK
jgi:hypothetical protein